ncbi:MAG: amino acid permease [Verrucomicrobia bacterium]|jgi:amino acid transporter|nr:amino acid permease [Verrucomicrobiota bacterium]MBT7065592.1 amino acid permease [Verrucomicrobiota bacterium]MBT7700158.1 amino acid permease [Verrucomicrobiota bacterium]
MAQQTSSESKSGRFGTFGGVFTPCTLTILGVILFLRFGMVVGNAGILHAIGIVLAAKLITMLTALSLSAMATNTRVRGGGAYFLISRSLGIEFGGAIGVVFYLSQAVSVALYIMGFTEALLAVVPSLAAAPVLTATAVNVAVFVCVLIGAGWAIKVQYAILVLLLMSIVSFAVGALTSWSPQLLAANMGASYETGNGYWIVFAIFFPAVTGIMAGANMSGDLKDPGRSIPRGTLLSIVFTGAVYLAFAVLLGGSSERAALQSNTMIVSKVAWIPALIVAGVFAATLSSALGSMMGAPRILQALARDNVLPGLAPFGKGSGPAGEPRRATIASFAIAQAGLMLGDLNAIAPVITMFFMITYGAINVATFAEAYSGNPSYRPTFRWCHWSLSLVGAVLCAGVMLLINPLWAIIAGVTMFAIYRYLVRQELQASWGDVVSGAVLERVRRDLLLLEENHHHTRNWRPAILVMGGGTTDKLHLSSVGRRLAGPHGLLMLGQVLVGNPDELLERHTQLDHRLRKRIADNHLEAFPAVIIAPSLTGGISSLIQTCGIGVVQPNTVLFGWNRNVEERAEFEENLRTVVRLGRSIVILRSLVPPEDVRTLPPGTVDVWWQGKGFNGHLMLLLAHILCSTPDMRGRTIRLIRMLPNEAGREETLAHLQQLSDEVRIPCEAVVVIGETFSPILLSESANAALVLLGIANPCEQEGGIVENLNTVVGELPNVLFVHSAGDMSLHS